MFISLLLKTSGIISVTVLAGAGINQNWISPDPECSKPLTRLKGFHKGLTKGGKGS